MATDTKTPKAPKVPKAPVALVTRLSDQLKRGAVGGKLTTEELTKLESLIQALKHFTQS